MITEVPHFSHFAPSAEFVGGLAGSVKWFVEETAERPAGGIERAFSTRPTLNVWPEPGSHGEKGDPPLLPKPDHVAFDNWLSIYDTAEGICGD